MWRNLLILILFAASCSTTPKQPSATNNHKTVIFDSILHKTDTINLGYINEGEVLTGKFAVKNESEKPLIIGSIITGCGCVATNYDKKPIREGEERIIEFTFDSKGRQGWQIKAIDVITTDHKLARIILEAQINPRK